MDETFRRKLPGEETFLKAYPRQAVGSSFTGQGSTKYAEARSQNSEPGM